MYYETLSKRTIVDQKGNDKEVSEKFIVENCEICAQAEVKTLEYWNVKNDVISVKQSKIREFVNERENDEQFIYLATIEDKFVDEENGEEKATKYVVGLFAQSLEEATTKVLSYMKQGINDMSLTAIRRTKIVELLK